MSHRRIVGLIGGSTLILLVSHVGQTQGPSRQAGADWPMYRHDYAGTGYSPLAQITTKNVARLREVWTYRLYDDPAPAPPGKPGASPNSQATPIVVNGGMYVPASNRIVALDPETGAERWRHIVSGGVPSRRGVAHWSGDAGASRIVFMAGRRLVALDAQTGKPAEGFGTNSEVDVVVPYNSVPLVY